MTAPTSRDAPAIHQATKGKSIRHQPDFRPGTGPLVLSPVSASQLPSAVRRDRACSEPPKRSSPVFRRRCALRAEYPRFLSTVEIFASRCARSAACHAQWRSRGALRNALTAWRPRHQRVRARRRPNGKVRRTDAGRTAARSSATFWSRPCATSSKPPANSTDPLLMTGQWTRSFRTLELPI